jgi:hypothetical protein
MIANNGMFLNRTGKLFTQLLSSINYDGDNPIGMIDSISGNNAVFKDSNCWVGVTGSHFYIPGLLTTDTVEVFGDSDTPTIPVDGQLHLANGLKAYGIQIKRSGVEIGIFSFSEDITDAGNHTAFNKSTVTVNKLPNATLINGTPPNEGLQDEYHWSQNGVSIGTRWSGLGGAEVDPVDIGTTGIYRFEYLVKPYNTAFNYFNIVSFDPTAGGDNIVYCGRSQIALSVDGILYSYSAALPITNYSNVVVTINRSGNFEVFIDDLITPVYTADISTHSGVIWNNPNTIIGGLSLGSSNSWVGEILYGSFKRNGVETYRFNKVYTKSTLIQIPASAALDGTDALGNPLTLVQDGSFLNTGNTIQNPDVAALKLADIYNVWYDGVGTPKKVTFSELQTAIQTYPDVYGGVIITDESIKNISLK